MDVEVTFLIMSNFSRIISICSLKRLKMFIVFTVTSALSVICFHSSLKPFLRNDTIYQNRIIATVLQFSGFVRYFYFN